jgi:hypothetical protein
LGPDRTLEKTRRIQPIASVAMPVLQHFRDQPSRRSETGRLGRLPTAEGGRPACGAGTCRAASRWRRGPCRSESKRTIRSTSPRLAHRASPFRGTVSSC